VNKAIFLWRKQRDTGFCPHLRSWFSGDDTESIVGGEPRWRHQACILQEFRGGRLVLVEIHHSLSTQWPLLETVPSVHLPSLPTLNTHLQAPFCMWEHWAKRHEIRVWIPPQVCLSPPGSLEDTEHVLDSDMSKADRGWVPAKVWGGMETA
jgi:hypothetical protein